MCSWAAVLQHHACEGLELLARKVDIKQVQQYHHVNYRQWGWFLWPRLPFLGLWALLMKTGSGDRNKLPRTLLAKPITEVQ